MSEMDNKNWLGQAENTAVVTNQESIPTGFSWTLAAQWSYFYAYTRQWWMLIVVILSGIFVIPIFIWFFYIGFKGKEIIYTQSEFTTHAEKMAAIKTAQNQGVIWLVGFIFMLIYFATMIATMIATIVKFILSM